LLLIIGFHKVSFKTMLNIKFVSLKLFKRSAKMVLNIAIAST